MTRRTFTAALLASNLATTAFAQAPTSPAAASQRPAFEIVSIHPSQPGSPLGGQGILPDGYNARWPISLIIQEAYFPPADAADDARRPL